MWPRNWFPKSFPRATATTSNNSANTGASAGARCPPKSRPLNEPVIDSVERFTGEEREALAPYFTELDGPVFALINLPEVVKGALFARYSRSAKSLRRLFLDEFYDQAQKAPSAASVGSARAEKLYERVFFDSGLYCLG